MKMLLYDFAATEWEADPTARFIGFANNGTGQYFSMQREEGSEASTLPHAGNVWIERDDQSWAGHGGLVSLHMDRRGLSVRLTEEMAARLGGCGYFRVAFAFAMDYPRSANRLFLSWPDTKPSWKSRIN